MSARLASFDLHPFMRDGDVLDGALSHGIFAFGLAEYTVEICVEAKQRNCHVFQQRDWLESVHYSSPSVEVVG